MATLNIIKDRLIGRILITKNNKLLTAIDHILDSTEGSKKLTLDSEQIEMLKMSEKIRLWMDELILFWTQTAKGLHIWLLERTK